MHKKNLYPNTVDFQLENKEKRKKRKKRMRNETHGRPLVLQYPRLVSSPVFSLVFSINPVTFRVIK
jgi:hypothetical protein